MPERERAFWVAEHELEAGKCPQCGGDREVCGDPDVSWYPQRSVCYATMANQAANARYDAEHDDMPYHDGTFKNWGPKRSALFPFERREGVVIWVAPDDIDPDADWL